MPPTDTAVPPITPVPSVLVAPPSPSGATASRADLALDFIVTQLRGTFDGKLEQMLALPAGDPACAAIAAALDDINAALARVHDGSYGICDRCDGEISAARLEVVPTTTTCTPCKAAAAPPR